MVNITPAAKRVVIGSDLTGSDVTARNVRQI